MEILLVGIIGLTSGFIIGKRKANEEIEVEDIEIDVQSEHMNVQYEQESELSELMKEIQEFIDSPSSREYTSTEYVRDYKSQELKFSREEQMKIVDKAIIRFSNVAERSAKEGLKSFKFGVTSSLLDEITITNEESFYHGRNFKTFATRQRKRDELEETLEYKAMLADFMDRVSILGFMSKKTGIVVEFSPFPL